MPWDSKSNLSKQGEHFGRKDMRENMELLKEIKGIHFDLNTRCKDSRGERKGRRTLGKMKLEK